MLPSPVKVRSLLSRWRGVWLALVVSLPGPAESSPAATDSIPPLEDEPALATQGEAGHAESASPEEDPADGPPYRDAPRAGQPCKLQQFFQNLASTNARARAIDVGLAEQTLWSNVGFTRGKRRVTVPRSQILKELEQRRGDRFRTLMRLGDSLRRGWAEPGGDGVVRLFPSEAGSLLYVARDFQVRIYGEGCEGHITEIRDTQGSWLPPRALEPDQPGFDCHYDRRVFDTDPPRSLIQGALKERLPDYEGTRLVHTIFPRSSTPMIREVQHHAGGECSQVYFGLFSDPDTCDGRKVSLGEEKGKLYCCSAEACEHSVEYYFYALMDALSFRRAGAIKGYIRPGRGLKLTGYPFDHGRMLTRSTPNAEVVAAFAHGPGWVGTDQPSCSDTTPVEIDYGDARPETAECVFGGGGQFFSFDFWRAGPGERWYATELRGDAH